jgi:hypothetical protein
MVFVSQNVKKNAYGWPDSSRLSLYAHRKVTLNHEKISLKLLDNRLLWENFVKKAIMIKD